jgi:HlyD family secretion protein
MRTGIVVVALLALGGCAAEESEPVVVGTLERDRIEIQAEAWETLVELRVFEGEAVRAGQVIARQAGEREAARRAQAAAAAEAARRRLAELERGPRPEDIAEARARLRGAQSVLATESREFDRVADLVDQALLPEADLDRARARRDDARARSDEARSRLEALVAGTTVEELDQARAALAEAEALVSERRLAVERLALRATRDGRIDSLPFEVGDRPTAGATVAVLLADGPPWARVYVPAAIRPRVRPGTPATVTVAGVEGTFAARVRTISSEAAFTPYFALTEHDRGRLSYLAEVDLLDDAASALPAGLPLELRFRLQDIRTDP